MTDNHDQAMAELTREARELLAGLRAEDRNAIVEELGIHAESPEHRCLCARWDGSGTYAEHVADELLTILYGEP